MRNSVILVDQIRQDEEEGKTRWETIVDSTVRRFRPISPTLTGRFTWLLKLLVLA